MEFLQALKNRRSIYNLGTNVNLSNEEITSIISDCLKYSPSAFNYPTTNVIIAFGEKHQQIWQITTDILKEKLAKKEETFAVAQNKINKFKAGVGTILFFEVTEIINELIETYLKIAYGIKPGCWLDAEKGLLQENTLYPKLKQMINDGNINDAEDILYEYANPINPDILKVGLFFYYDLNRMADAELEAADFTRDEVKEGVQELLKIYDQENFGTIFR